jgi:hypothetical protein
MHTVTESAITVLFYARNRCFVIAMVGREITSKPVPRVIANSWCDSFRTNDCSMYYVCLMLQQETNLPKEQEHGSCRCCCRADFVRKRQHFLLMQHYVVNTFFHALPSCYCLIREKKSTNFEPTV